MARRGSLNLQRRRRGDERCASWTIRRPRLSPVVGIRAMTSPLRSQRAGWQCARLGRPVVRESMTNPRRLEFGILFDRRL